jgi:hypothetical protein
MRRTARVPHRIWHSLLAARTCAVSQVVAFQRDLSRSCQNPPRSLGKELKVDTQLWPRAQKHKCKYGEQSAAHDNIPISRGLCSPYGTGPKSRHRSDSVRYGGTFPGCRMC